MNRLALRPLLFSLLLGCGEDSTEPGGGEFDGYWNFDLTIAGSACPGDVSGRDCFAIHQTGDTVFIVDDAHGNLIGSVDGNVATLARNTADESIYLELTMQAGGNRLVGFAIEADSTLACTTELDVVGTRREEPCVR